MKLSCVTASYVADLLGYPGEIDWTLAAERVAQAPLLETIDVLLDRLAPARLDGLELWYPHVWPATLTPVLASEVRRRLAARGLVCCACAGGMGNPDEDLYGCEELFQVAALLRAPLISAHVEAGAVPHLGALCERYRVRLAFENGPERDGSQIANAVAGGGPWVGVAIDTGNLAARGGDPVRAIRELGDAIVHVHMKDVPAAGADDCVALGTGIVDVAGVIEALQSCGYDGWLSIEVETGDRDPTDEIVASAETIRRLWR
jgi:sugar phosphate isomerase/epimerase